MIGRSVQLLIIDAAVEIALAAIFPKATEAAPSRIENLLPTFEVASPICSTPLAASLEPDIIAWKFPF